MLKNPSKTQFPDHDLKADYFKNLTVSFLSKDIYFLKNFDKNAISSFYVKLITEKKTGKLGGGNKVCNV